VHNLQNVDLTLPKRALVVFTGPSGSGKSSLAFDTIYSEGRRRYVESLSTYARQFLGQMEKPDVDLITGLSPTISIEQKTTSNSPRSTVGTITEIYDHMRVLWSKLGVQHCYECGEVVQAKSPDAIVEEVLELPARTKFMLLAPMVRQRKGEFKDLFEKLRRQGFGRVRVDGEILDLDDMEKVPKSYRHDIDVVIDRLIMKESVHTRVAESVRLALRTSPEEACVLYFPSRGNEDEGEERLLSARRSCCGIAYPELTHQSFSFNSPMGMCPTCKGLGYLPQAEEDLIVGDAALSIKQGALLALGPGPRTALGRKFKDKEAVKEPWKGLEDVAEKMAMDLDIPWAEMSDADHNYVLYGSTRGRRKRATGYKGVVHYIERGAKKGRTAAIRNFFGEFIAPHTCPDCQGARLRPESRAVRFLEMPMEDATSRSVTSTRGFFEEVELEGVEARIGAEVVREIAERMRFLENVGLGYLSLNRAANTLSGGESQRIRLASQLGSELSGVLYVLDEPSIGLHQRDNRDLIATLCGLRDRGNSVIVVEHDRDTMEAADYLVDFGPGAGRLGGQIVAEGTFQDMTEREGSITGDYLAGRRAIEVPAERRPSGGDALVITGAAANNLKGVDVRIPKGCFVCVTGVSGAGKSTLVNDILYPALARHLYTKHRSIGAHEAITGLDLFDKVIEIDQKPIGRTPRSNPATYTKVFDLIRSTFAGLPESKMYGFNKGRFSFNVAGGRCEECKGDGYMKVEMSFLADVYVRCEACQGKRFNDATLRVTYRGHTISDVLDMSIKDAHELFSAHPKIARSLQTLLDVGLDYIKLGQPSPTLSGGEAQRIKLSRELSKVATGDTLYILDEPSTGLHFDDIRKLLEVINRLVDAGNTVVMIEHNLDLIKCADVVVDLGPEGGEAGGHVVAWGTPEEVAEVPGSYTGQFLREELDR
jgi:excinuclease ABC subunit A